MFKQTQRSFAGGWLDRELMGRTDLAKYYTGASKLENFLVRRQGDLAKRRGTDLCANIKNLLGTTIDRSTGEETVNAIGRSRLVPVVHERDAGYYALLSGRKAFLVGDRGVYCVDGEWRRVVAQHYNPDTSTGTCDSSEAECFIEDIPYKKLSIAMAGCPPGHTVRLAKDVEAGGLLRCRGKLDLNGHKITVTNPATRITFTGRTDDSEVGLVDSTHGGGSIEWDVSSTYLSGDRIFINAIKGVLVVEGVAASFPFTGSLASFIKMASAVTSARIAHCSITTSAGRGVAWLQGGNTDLSRAVYVEECDLNTEDSGNPMFYNAASGAAYYRRIVLESGSYVCAGTLANKGAVVRGGVLICSSIGGSTGNMDVVAGLVSYQLGSGYVASGSEYKGTSANPLGTGTVYNYNLTTEGEYVYARNPIPETPPSPLSRTAPYSIDIPYEDGDLSALDTYQSGDTIFMAHRNYPPAKLTFRPDEMKLSFEVISFNASAWKRPRITSVTNNIHPSKSETSVQSGTTYRTTTTYTTSSSSCTKTIEVYKVTASSETLMNATTSTLPVRTVQYAVTYVKDGVESAPSNPVSVTYGAPWEDGGIVKLAFDKGDNAEEPDYYNVYKKEYTDYGLIGSTAQPSVTDPVPEVQGADTVDGETTLSDPDMAATGKFNGADLAMTDIRDVIAPVEGGIVTDVASRVVGSLGEFDVYRGVGGAQFGTAARFSFGSQSATAVNSVKIWFDLHKLVYVENPATGKVKVYDEIAGSGKRVTATVTYKNKTGSQTAATQSATVTLPAISYTPEGGEAATTYDGSVMHYCGEFDPKISATALREAIAREPRSATFSFSNVTDAKQIVQLDVVCEIEVDDGEGGTTWERVDAAICGVEFGFASSSSPTFEDEYITPNTSVTPPSEEASFRGRGNYPSCVGIYQQRLIFASTGSKPATFWMSATGDLYTFAPHKSIREDDALEATLAATEFPNINHIVMAHDILMFGDGGEWKISPISGNAITYKTLSATLQSSIGSAKWLKPIIVGNEIVFAERTGAAIRSVSYNYVQDGYESQDLTVLAGGIFAGNRIWRMCYKQHPDSTIVCALADGTLAALVYMKEHEVVAWSHHTLGGGWLARDVATCKALNGSTTDVMLTVKKGDEWELWTGRPDDPAPSVAAQACLDGYRQMTSAEAAAQGVWMEGWVAVDLLTGKIVAKVADLEAGRSYAVGWPIRSELVTVRPEPSPQDTIQFETKNLKNVEVRSIAGGTYTVKSFAAATGVKPTVARATPTVDAGAVVFVTSDIMTTVMGANTGDGRVQLVHEDIWPMSILQLSANYEIQPLSGSEG